MGQGLVVGRVFRPGSRSRDSLLERVDVALAHGDGDGVRIAAALGVAVGNADAARACRGDLLVRLRLLAAAGDAAQAETLLAALVVLLVVGLVVVFFLFAARQTRGAARVHRDLGDRLRLVGDVF